MAEAPPKGFTEEEWEAWSGLAREAKEISDAIGCTLDTALLMLALNDIRGKLADPDDDEPWNKKR